MKIITITMLLACSFLGASCSRSNTELTQATPTSTPALPSDSDRQQQADARAAEQRRKADLERAEAQRETPPKNPLSLEEPMSVLSPPPSNTPN
jgi:hypothetical protein